MLARLEPAMLRRGMEKSWIMSARWQTVGALVFFCALSVVQLRPVAANLSRAIIDGHGDVYVNIWVLGDLSDRVGCCPFRLFDGRIFYPYPNALASVDHMIANAVIGAPLRLVGMEPIALYNLVFLLTFALSGFFTFLLVRRLTDSIFAGLAAGCAFAFGTFRTTHLMHLHLLSTQWVPLAFLALHLFLETPTRRRLAGLTVAGLLVALSSWHVALISAVGLLVVTSVLLAADGRRPWKRLAGLTAAVALVAICLVPIARVYNNVLEDWVRPTVGEEPRELERIHYSATLDGLVHPSVRTRSLFRAILPDTAHGEARVFPGVIVLVFALPAVCRRWMPGAPAGLLTWLLRGTLALSAGLVIAEIVGVVRGAALPLVEGVAWLGPVRIFGAVLALLGLVRARWLRGEAPMVRASYAYGLLAIVGLLLSLGPRITIWRVDLGPGFDVLNLLPRFHALRAPARFSLLLSFGVAVLAGLGAARVQRHVPGTMGVVGAATALALLTLDVRLNPVSILRAPNRAAIHRWLAEHPEPGAAIEYPEANNPWAVLASLDYDRRIVNGTSYVWPSTLVLGDKDALSARQMELLWQDLHPRFVVLRSELFPPGLRERVGQEVQSRPDSLRLLAEFGAGDAVYELVDRGRGQRLFRRWPASRLWAPRGLVVSAARSRGPASRRGVVARRGHGRPRASWTPDNRPRFVPLDPAAIQDGINVVEVEGRYRQPDSMAGHDIGTTGVTLPADVAVASAEDGAWVLVNGREIAVDKGYLLVVLDPDRAEILETGVFNTSWHKESSAALVEFVRRIPVGHPVLVASEFDVSRRLTPEAVESLRALGLREDLRARFRWAHAAIGVKGAPAGSAREVAAPQQAILTLGEIAAPVVQLDGLQIQ